MNVQYLVDLTDTEREQLEALNRGGVAPVRRLKRANILLMSERGHTAAEIEACVQHEQQQGGESPDLGP